MRVLLGASRVGETPATLALAALAEGWRAGNPEADLVPVVCSDGAHDLLDAVESAWGGRRAVVPVLRRDATADLPALLLHVGSTAYVQAGDVLGSLPSAATSLRPPALDPEQVLAATSFGVGQLALTALAAGAQRIVIGCDDAPLIDLGAGFVRALAGLAPGATDALEESITAARSVLGRTELVLAAASATTARGLRGAASVLADRVGRERAAAWDRELAGPERVLSDAAGSARRPDLLDPGAPRPRPGATPGAGAGGGLGLAVLALGGRVVPGAAFVAAETDLAARAGAVDLAVCLSDRIDPLEADRGVLGAIAAVGRAQGAAVLALGAGGSLERRAGAPYGVSASALVPSDGAGIVAAGEHHGRAWRW